ncbi:MAG: bifunctional diguanylate cyclase/phosphodiesterase [Acidimicrobiia bacterium]
MDNTVLIGATIVAVAIAIGATIAAMRSARRASRAADQVARLLDPPVMVASAPVRLPPQPEPRVDAAVASTFDGAVVPDFFTAPTLSTELAPSADAAHVGFALGRGDTNPPRIPVFDLDRLRGWLTDENVRLGRIAVVSVEIDNLGYVNERLGYRAGTHLIEAITQRLRSVTRPRDVVAHVNQERFVLVCRDVPDHDAAAALAERIAMGVAHPSVVVSGVAEVTASIGVALASDTDQRPEAVLRRAIKAGNRARSLGGARIEICDDAPSPSLADAEFARALTDGELRVHYLPIVSCATGRVAGFETLVRWDHPERGMLLPSEFLPQAERNGAIIAIGTWAIEHACRQMAEWHQGAGTTLKLNMNLSSREFAEPSLPAHIKRVIGETGLPPGAVWLEITEETLLENRDGSDRTLGRLHEIGVHLVIDDFGAGASSLVSLKQFPLDAIKIDRAFVSDLGANRDSDAICTAIVELAHSLGLCAIAEGVETMEQFAALRAIGCELGQGRLFGPARPAGDYGATPSATLGIVQST